MTSAIVVVDDDPHWPVAFVTIRATLKAALAGVAVIGIEHVGSTSVPGLRQNTYVTVARAGLAITALDEIEAGNRL